MRPNFYTRATNFKQNLPKISHHFPKLFKLSSKFKEFWYQIDETGHIFAPILENFENMTHVKYQFLHWIRGHRFTRRLILRPISVARPRIDLCTKNPPGIYLDSEIKKSLIIPTYLQKLFSFPSESQEISDEQMQFRSYVKTQGQNK